MATIIERGNNLPPEIVREMFNGVAGKSSLAKMSDQRPISFNGTREFVFTLDKEADLVAENGAKTVGGGEAIPVTVIPYKFEYGVRVSDEFLYGTEEYRMDVLRTFADGAARKFARGFDIAAITGLNPRTLTASAVVGDNNFMSVLTEDSSITYDSTTPDANLTDAITEVQANNGAVNGLIMTPGFASAMAGVKVDGVTQYPEFRFGANPERFYGMNVDVNTTPAPGTSGGIMALVGDFSAFRWGYAKDIEYDVIRYGNPDNDATLGDLKGHNQVYLRAEAYIGWGILNPAWFAAVVR